MSTNKYDRQTRLWGEGQYLISTGALLVLGVDCTSLEILKNLVLSGIGHITLVDKKLISKKDIEENFFLSTDDKDKEISKVCLESILELNPDVKGNYHTQDVEEFLLNKNNDLSSYDLIISCNNSNKINLLANNLCKEKNIKFVAVSNYGLLGYIRLYETYHAGLQLKLTDKPVVDLRIPLMWKELIDYCESFVLESQTDIDHETTPYVIILYHALKQYKSKYNKIPKSFQDKEDFKALIANMMRNKDEENYLEAINFNYYASEANTNLITPILSNLFSLISDDNNFISYLTHSNRIMKAFFSTIKGLFIFYKKFNSLPVVGSLTDMSSGTNFYINLKKIYEARAKADKDELIKIIKEEVLPLVPNDSDSINKSIFNSDFNILDLVCKNWPQLNFQSFSFFETEFPNLTEIDAYEEKDRFSLNWYVLMKASEVFYMNNGRYPGSSIKKEDSENIIAEEDFDYLSDKTEFISILNSYINEANREPNNFINSIKDIEDDFICEFLRNGKLKVIPIVSIVGSIASQEIIKLLTYSFETITNTVIFDGINVNLSVFDMKD